MEEMKRKEKNSNNYQQHKIAILERATTKITCQFCSRIFINNNLQKHYPFPICTNTQSKNKILLDRKTHNQYTIIRILVIWIN